MHQIPTTPYLLVPRAEAGLLNEPDLTPTTTPGESSYLMNSLDGSFVWEKPSLPLPNKIFVFPHLEIAIFRSGDRKKVGQLNELTAFDYRTGNILWRDQISALTTRKDTRPAPRHGS